MLTLSLLAALAIVLLLILSVEGDESIGFGGVLELNDGAADAYVVIPKVETLGIPTQVTGTTESKALDLPEGVIQKLPNLKDGGTFQFKYHVIAATNTRLETIRAARTIKNWKVSVPCDTGFIVVIVPGFVQENRIEELESEKLTVGMVTVVVSGANIAP